ncbi:MAG TPA: hypothetical protein VM032_14505 [Vicinamibacterales bacterium]|nr:hypothetical protein [Vicinamibacterales bacterium]
MTQLKMLTADDKIAEIRRLYFGATRQSIEQHLAKALDLLKSMASEEERERATVFMEGLAEMRNDWLKERKPKGTGGRSRGGGGGGRNGAKMDGSGPPARPAKKR